VKDDSIDGREAGCCSTKELNKGDAAGTLRLSDIDVNEWAGR
jgi:hypothetical protein